MLLFSSGLHLRARHAVLPNEVHSKRAEGGPATHLPPCQADPHT